MIRDINGQQCTMLTPGDRVKPKLMNIKNETKTKCEKQATNNIKIYGFLQGFTDISLN